MTPKQQASPFWIAFTRFQFFINKAVVLVKAYRNLKVKIITTDLRTVSNRTPSRGKCMHGKMHRYI